MIKNIYITIGGFYVGSTAVLDALEDNNFYVQYGDFDLFRSKYGLLNLANTDSKYILIKCYFNIIFVCNKIIFSVLKLYIKRYFLKKLNEREFYSLYNNWQHSLKSFISISIISNKIFIKRLFNKKKLSDTKINFEKLIYLYSIHSKKKVFHNCHNLKNFQIKDYKLEKKNKYKINYIVVTRNPIDQLLTALDFHVKDPNDNRFAKILDSEKNYYKDHIFRLRYVTEISLKMARQRLKFIEELSKFRKIKIISFEELVSSNNYRIYLSSKFPEHNFNDDRYFQFIQEESFKNVSYKSKILSRDEIKKIVPNEIKELKKINEIVRNKFELI